MIINLSIAWVTNHYLLILYKMYTLEKHSPNTRNKLVTHVKRK
jgi:hypothetical protein